MSKQHLSGVTIELAIFFCTNFNNPVGLKGTATLMISMFYKKELCKARILILVSSNRLNNGEVVDV